MVYKGVKDYPLKETAEKEAKTIYAQNKLACEQYLKMCQNYYGIDYTVFRIGVPYGNLLDDNYSYGTLGFFLDKVKNKEDITLYGDGSQKRTFTHVGDIAQIIVGSLAIDNMKNNIYNIGSNDNLSLIKVAQTIAHKYALGVDFVEWPEEALKIESGDTIFDDSKLQKSFTYLYQYKIEEWLKGL